MKPANEPYTPQQIEAALSAAYVCHDWRDAVVAVSERLNVPVTLVIGRSRSTSVARCRQVVMTALRQRGMSLKEIASKLKKDHSTVIHGVRLVERLLVEVAA